MTAVCNSSSDLKVSVPATYTKASLSLDLVRGAAALIVLISHWQHLFFVDYSQLSLVSRRNPLIALAYLLTSAGHQAVIIFFVLSGYLISKSVLRAFREDRWSWSTYLLNRLTRLWIVLIPILGLTFLLDHVGMHLHLPYATSLYAGLGGSRILGEVSSRSGLGVAFGNCLFLQNILVPTFDTNGALWSLANEFWYYMLFPLAILTVRKDHLWITRLMYATLFLGLAYFLRHGILQLFPIWLFGTLIAVAPASKHFTNKLTSKFCLAAYLPVFYFFSRYRGLSGLASDTALGVLTAFFLWILISAGAQPACRTTSHKAVRSFAKFSYTLYVFHIPALALAAAVILRGSRWLPTGFHLLEGAGVLISVILGAYLLACVTEFRTEELRSLFGAFGTSFRRTGERWQLRSGERTPA